MFRLFLKRIVYGYNRKLFWSEKMSGYVVSFDKMRGYFKRFSTNNHPCSILYLHISHNSPLLHPPSPLKILHNDCVQFLLRHKDVPREI